MPQIVIHKFKFVFSMILSHSRNRQDRRRPFLFHPRPYFSISQPLFSSSSCSPPLAPYSVIWLGGHITINIGEGAQRVIAYILIRAISLWSLSRRGGQSPPGTQKLQLRYGPVSQRISMAFSGLITRCGLLVRHGRNVVC